MGEVKYNSKEPSMLTIIKPVILVNQFLGVCPHDIKGELLIFNKRSFKFYKTIFTIIILLLQLSFTITQFYRALLTGQNMLKLGLLFAVLTAPAISLLILAVTLQKREQFTHFFKKLQEFKATVCMQGISNCPLVVRLAWRFYGFYMLLALLHASLVAYDTYIHPTSEIYLLYYIKLPSTPLVILNSVYQFYLVLVSQSACALVEVLCASVSCSIVNKIGKIRNQMKLKIGEEADFGYGTTNKCQALLMGSNCKNSSGVGSEDGLKAKEAYDIPYYPTTGAHLLNIEKNEDNMSTGPILQAIKRYSYIAEKQRLINCIFGPILALDIAWLVIHVCLLFFLQIRSLGIASAHPHYELNENYNSTGKNVEIIESMGGDMELIESTSNRIGFFAGQGLIYLIRLLIVLISLGNVHAHARCFDADISSSLLKIQNPREIDLHLIQVHLLGSHSNPVAFSAGGFFLFTKGTILYVFSIVTTYVVFLLQA